jgi:UDP-N-acetylglucosamine acyltransferase
MSIHPMAVVHPEAKIGKNVVIEPFAVVAADVIVGEGSRIGAHAVIGDGVRMGKNCQIFNGASVGSIPQDLKFAGEYSTLELGDEVVVREFCTLNRGTAAAGSTKIGKKTLLMAYVHVAHDCFIGENCVLANNVTLGGHVEIGDFVVLGGLVAVHQFAKIGSHVMVGGTGKVRKDIPPFILADREPLCYMGVNARGLARRGFSQDQIHRIEEAYRLLFLNNLNVSQAVFEIEKMLFSNERDQILGFLKGKNRGILTGPRLNNSKIEIE